MIGPVRFRNWKLFAPSFTWNLPATIALFAPSLRPREKLTSLLWAVIALISIPLVKVWFIMFVGPARNWLEETWLDPLSTPVRYWD